MVDVEKVVKEFEAAAKRMSNVGPCITIFGSARTKPTHEHYKAAVEIAKGLSESGYGIITGGGGGIMEAGNKGASLGGGKSVGLSIFLPFETCANDFVNNNVDFNYFFARKVIFVNYSSAFVIAPGGVGTLDEFFEVFTLIQTGKIKKRPIVLYDSSYWKPLIEQLKSMVGYTISAQDIDLLKISDDPQEVIDYLNDNIIQLPSYWKG
ncbi:MAG: TIGR00730 family Rossman fold protein [Flavobacteriaceae bacterium]